MKYNFFISNLKKKIFNFQKKKHRFVSEPDMDLLLIPDVGAQGEDDVYQEQHQQTGDQA